VYKSPALKGVERETSKVIIVSTKLNKKKVLKIVGLLKERIHKY